MNRLTEIMTNSLSPEMAIVVYTGDNQEYYLERRDIKNGKMTEGVPLTEECLSDISKVLSNQSDKKLHGIIPPFMLYTDSRPGQEKYIWYRKPEKRMMYFSQRLGVENGEMMLPGLIYLVNNKTLSVFAVKRKRGISLNTKIYRGPFFNVYNNSSVCLGSTKARKPKSLTYESVIKYWEDKFWLSEFDHILGSNPIKGNLSTVTKKCIKTGREFPVDKLIPIKKLTIKDLLK